MTLCKTARTAMGMSQTAFGKWLGERTKGKPIVQPAIAAYEAGKHVMGKDYRAACAPVAASWLVMETHKMEPEQAAKLIMDALR